MSANDRPLERDATRDRPSRLPNLITATRLVLLPVLWYLALSGESRWLGVGVAVAAATDVADGVLARWLHSRSELGSRFDSLSDHLLSASVLIWLVILRPEFVARNVVALGLFALFGVFTLAVGWVRFRRFGDVHLYSTKAASLVAYLFVVYLLLFDEYSPMFFYVAIGAGFLAAAETLLVYLTRGDPNERIGSILLRRRG